MIHDDGFALLIGIDDYRAFDRSQGRPEGSSSLAGSVLDAHVFWRLCLQLGMTPDRIRVAASPRPDLSLFPGATAASFVDATEAGLRGALRWLADRLAAGPGGLLTYSGHGAHRRDRGLLMCPSDTSGDSFDHAIPFHELRSLLGGGAANLTVVLDCCHGGPAAPDPRGRLARTLGGDPLPPGEREDEMLIGARVLAACRPGQVTEQASFGGRPHGAFSWAVGSILEQWKAVDDGGNVRLDLTYGTLIDRARQLLAVLDFGGTPTLYGPAGAGALSVLQVGRRPQPTAGQPDAPRQHVQMDPGQRDYRLYTFQSDTGVTVARVLVPASDRTFGHVTYSTRNEYWAEVASSLSTGALTVTWSDHGWGRHDPLPDGALSFTMEQAPDWTGLGSGAPASGPSVFASNDLGVVLAWNLQQNDEGGWGGTLQWFDTTGRSNVFRGAMPSGGVRLEASLPPSAPAGWYTATLRPAPL